VRLDIALAVALAITVVAQTGHGADPGGDTLWEGAGGVIMPLGEPTPVRVDLLVASFTAVPPPRRTLEDPRFAEQWEVSTRMELTNGSDAPCSLTLGLPQRAADDPDAPPAIDHAVVSLDHKRLRIERVNEPGPAIPGAPPLVVRHAVSIDFEPGQSRRVDTLFRVRAPFAGGAVRFRFVLGGAQRFAGGEIGRARFEWHFGERVRLTPEDGRQVAWIAEPPEGAKHSFLDDGRETRLALEIEKLKPTATLELAAAPVGLGRDQGAPILGEMRPIESMSALELELARATYLALYGRAFRDPDLREVFEDRPWADCNPAFRVAHGVAIEEQTLADFLATHPCDAGCVADRRQPSDPYGPAFEQPLCWYAPEHNLSLTRVTDPEIEERVRAIETRLEKLATAEAASRPAPEPDSGCLCSAVGAGFRGRAPSLLELLLSALRDPGR